MAVGTNFASRLNRERETEAYVPLLPLRQKQHTKEDAKGEAKEEAKKEAKEEAEEEAEEEAKQRLHYRNC